MLLKEIIYITQEHSWPDDIKQKMELVSVTTDEQGAILVYRDPASDYVTARRRCNMLDVIPSICAKRHFHDKSYTLINVHSSDDMNIFDIVFSKKATGLVVREVENIIRQNLCKISEDRLQYSYSKYCVSWNKDRYEFKIIHQEES